MSNKQIIGQYFFENETVNRQNYLQILKNYSYPIMQRQTLNNKMIFQQDDARPHFSKLRAWLNEKFHGRWIGRGDPIRSAPRYPDFTPHGLVLWGCIKTKVYKTKVNDIAALKKRIEQEIKAIKKQTLENIFDGIVKRFKFWIDVNGETYEQYI